MNILLATPLYSQHFDAGHFWLRALNQLGHSVSIWDYRLDKNPPPFTHYPDVTIVLKGESIDPRKLPRLAIVYWPDALERTPGIEEVLKHYNKVFTPVRPTPEGMVWLPTGWDPMIHRDLNLVRSGSLYIGTLNSEYKKNSIYSIHPDTVRGNGWGLMPPVYLHELTDSLNRGEVLIDVHQAPNVGLNRKFFEMIACGFTIVDRVPGVEEVLGKELAGLVSFKDPPEAVELINYYLKYPDERRIHWEQERKAIEPYTYKAAVERILGSLK